MKPLSIYIHIPFCVRKCSYCDFVSVAKPDSYKERYIDALITEIRSSADLAASHSLSTIYIGGGTPSLLGEDLLEMLLAAVSENYNTDSIEEYTFECNPESITPQKLELLKRYGVNRLSIGLQSTDREELLLLRRSHDYDAFLSAYALARKHGFENISVDLMFAVPGQSMDTLQRSLESITTLGPEHISCYSLIVEENTLMNRWVSEGKIELPEDDEYVDMYRFLTGFLEQRGYRQYEISNFCREGFESVHNKAYWLRDNYLGLGVAAHSMIDNRRFANIDSVDDYMEKISDMESPVNLDSLETLSHSDVINEMIFLGLRMNKGIALYDIRSELMQLGRCSDSSCPLVRDFDKKTAKLEKDGLVQVSSGSLALTQKGRELSNSVFAELMVD